MAEGKTRPLTTAPEPPKAPIEAAPSTFANAAGYCLLLLAIPAAILLPRLTIDNRLERWVLSDEASAAEYARFRADFGSDEFIIAALTHADLFSLSALDAMVDALEEIEALPDVVAVLGLPRVYRDQFGMEDAESLRDEILNSPFYRKVFISEDGNTAGLIIQTEPSLAPNAREELVRGVSAALERPRATGFEVRLVGPPVLNVNLDRLSRSETVRTFPIAVGASMLILVLLLRSVRAALTAFLSAALTLLLLLGVIALYRVPLNMITAVLPALIWVLALANVIHLIRRYQRVLSAGRAIPQAVSIALREVGFPNALSAITTACGFFSLIIADMAPIRELAVFAASGMLLSLGVNMTVAPLLIRLLRVPAGRLRALASLPMPVWPRPAHGRLITALGLLFTLACIGGMTQIRVESNPLSFFPADSRTRANYEAVGRELAGFFSLEIVLDLPGPWTDPAVTSVIDRFQRRLEQERIVPRAYSPLDTLRLLHQWDNDFDPAFYTLPASQAAAEALLGDLGQPDATDLGRYLANDGKTIRISALVNEMNSGPFLAFVQDVRNEIAALPEGYAGDATGIVLQLVSAQESLVRTQVRSFALAFLFVFACIFIGLGSLRLTAISILPNVLPVLAAFAAMGALGIPLDAATVMVASIALGVSVDDTVHILAAFRRETAAHRDRPEAIRAALHRVGPSMIITTLTACAGFLALCGSEFIPIGYFGMLSTIALITALGADLMLVPALLAFNLRRKR